MAIRKTRVQNPTSAKTFVESSRGKSIGLAATRLSRRPVNVRTWFWCATLSLVSRRRPRFFESGRRACSLRFVVRHVCVCPDGVIDLRCRHGDWYCYNTIVTEPADRSISLTPCRTISTNNVSMSSRNDASLPTVLLLSCARTYIDRPVRRIYRHRFYSETSRQQPRFQNRSAT